MTQNSNIPSFDQKTLLELSMSIGQFRGLQQNAEAFVNVFKQKLKLTACEIWLTKGQVNRRIYKSSIHILNDNRPENLAQVIKKTSETKVYSLALANAKRSDSKQVFARSKGVLYAISLSEQLLLIAYDSKIKVPLPSATLKLLIPVFQRFGICLDQNLATQELKKTRTQIKESKEKQRQLDLFLNNVSDGIIICDLNMDILFVNDRLSELTENEKENYLSLNISDLPRQENYTREIKKMLSSTFKRGTSFNYTIPHIKKYSKTKWWAKGNISPYRSIEGKIIGAIATIQDVTKEKLTHQSLKETQSQYNLLINNGFDGVLTYDLRNKKMLTVSKSLLDNIGYTKEEFLKLKVAQLAPKTQLNGQSSAKQLDDINNRLNSEGKVSYDWAHKRKDGSLLFAEVTAVRLLPPNHEIKIEIHKNISEKFLTQKKLEENTERLDKLFDFSPIPILIRSIKSHVFERVNQKFTELFGYTVDELNTLKRQSLVYEENRTAISKQMKQLLAGKISSFKNEKQYIRKDGSTFWGVATRSLVHLENETLLIGFIEDITQRKNAIAALQESESLVRSIFNSTIDKIVALDTDLKVTYFNKAAESFFKGFYKKEFKIGDQYIPKDPIIGKEWKAYYKRALKGETISLPRSYQLNGEERYDLVNISPIKDQNQHVKGITLYGKDITELNQAQKALKKSEQNLIASNQKYQDLFNNMYDALLTIDKNGYFVNVNKAAEYLLEYPLEELRKMRVRDVVHPDDIEKSKKYIERLHTEGFYSDYQGRIITKSGKIKYLQVNSNAIIENGKVVGSRDIARDISELKETEAKREQLFSELEIANKELKDFAYIVSHDLKAPLRAISSLSKWIAEDYQPLFDEEGKKHLALLTGRADRMQKFIEGILQYSRLGRLKVEKEMVDVKKIIHEILDDLVAPRQFVFHVDSDIPLVFCEDIRIRQVFQNLISNAIKYNDKNTGELNIKYIDSEDFYTFQISDNGPGIEDKHFEKIFQIFQTLQARDQLESTGIGLTIVKKIIELHGGEITVNSVLYEGTTFTFTLLKQSN